MASQNQRRICRPRTTRAQALRQAKSAAVIDARAQPPPVPHRLRSNPARFRHPLPEPKRLDFSKPGVTKAMMVRLQHAQKLKEAEEQKRLEEERVTLRRHRRTAAPSGGVGRFGRERSAKQCPSQPTLYNSGLRAPRNTIQEDFQRGPSSRGHGGPSGMNGSRRLVRPGVNRRYSTGGHMRSTVSDAANRSMLIIEETLDEQDEAECLVVQNKLQDLQNARRNFVMAIANVSGNAVSFADDLNTSVTLPGSPLAYQPSPLPLESPQRYLYRIPDMDDPYLQVDMERHQATLANARQFRERRDAAQSQREAQRRIDEEFARVAAHVDEDLRYADIPFEQEIMEDDVSFEEDEDGTLFPHPDIEELERFLDTKNYPPVVTSSYNERRSPRRETLHPDFSELEDPWYRECPPQNQDIIDFDLMEFSPPY